MYKPYVSTDRQRRPKAILTTSKTGLYNPDDLRSFIEASLDSDKAENIETINLKGQTVIADYMVVASGRSTRQVCALAKKLQDRLKARGVEDIRVEGLDQGNWVIVDAGDVVIHLFRPEVREFYNIEKMWSSIETQAPLNGYRA